MIAGPLFIIEQRVSRSLIGPVLEGKQAIGYGFLSIAFGIVCAYTYIYRVTDILRFRYHILTALFLICCSTLFLVQLRAVNTNALIELSVIVIPLCHAYCFHRVVIIAMKENSEIYKP